MAKSKTSGNRYRVMRRSLLALALLLPLSGCFEEPPESQKDPPPGVRMLGCPAFETSGFGVATGASEALAEPPTNRSLAYKVMAPGPSLPVNVTGLPANWTNASAGWVHHGPSQVVRRSPNPLASDGWVRLAAGPGGTRLEGEFPTGVKAPAISKHVATWLMDRFEMAEEDANAVALQFVETRSASSPRAARQSESSLFRYDWAAVPLALTLNGTELIQAPEPRLRDVRVGNDSIRFSLEGRSVSGIAGDRLATLLVDPDDQAAVRIEALRPPATDDLPEIVAALMEPAGSEAFDLTGWRWATREVLLERTHALCRMTA